MAWSELQEEVADALGGEGGDDVGAVVRAPVHVIAGVAAVVRDAVGGADRDRRGPAVVEPEDAIARRR